MAESLTNPLPSPPVAETDRLSHAETIHSNALSRARLQDLFDSLPDGVVCVDRQYAFRFANRTARQFLGDRDVIGQNMLTLFPGNLQDPFAVHYRAAMEQRVEARFEAYAASSGNWMQIVARPFEDGIAIFFREINERKQAEATRDHTARRLQQVFDVTSDAILTIDRNWRFTFLNRRAQAVLAVKGDLIGRNVWKEFPASADLANGFWHPLHRAMDDRIPGEFEAFYPAPLDRFLCIECVPSDEGIVIFFHDITERRAADRVLKAQQDLLATVQRAALLATWDFDPLSGTITYGPGSFPVYGHPLDRISTRETFIEIIHPAHRERVRNGMRAVLETREMVCVDYQVLAADGSTRWVESRGQRIGGPETTPRAGGVALDITTRKRSEEALAESEARYRILADLNPQAIWMGAPDGRVTYANQGYLDYIGLTEAQIGGLGWLQAFYIEDRDRVVAAWSHSIATGEEYNVEARHVRAADGAVRWWWIRGRPVRDDSGTILHWLGVAMEIHETKTAAEVLHLKQQETERQRAELETIYQTADIGLALFSADDFRFLRVNDWQGRMMGLPPDQIIGRTLAEMAPGVPEAIKLFQRVAAGNPVRDHPLVGELPQRPGEERIWNVNYTPVFDSDGKVIAITSATIEITHQKKAEAALIQSEKLAAVGRLASSISHEINNPLEAITNLLYLIAHSGDLPEALRIYVHLAQSELSRVSQIATQTLRFHRQSVNPTHVTAASLVNAVLNLYHGRLANSSIQVDARYATDSPILCFENDIRQVLNNLIANAIDAMRKGGRLIARAHAAFDHRSGRHGVRITIADTGHGMSPATRARLFEPFFTTKDLNGTGLGLWISTGIVQRHQGRLSVRSSTHPARHGTVFTLFLPMNVQPTRES